MCVTNSIQTHLKQPWATNPIWNRLNMCTVCSSLPREPGFIYFFCRFVMILLFHDVRQAQSSTDKVNVISIFNLNPSLIWSQGVPSQRLGLTGQFPCYTIYRYQTRVSLPLYRYQTRVSLPFYIDIRPGLHYPYTNIRPGLHYAYTDIRPGPHHLYTNIRPELHYQIWNQMYL